MTRSRNHCCSRNSTVYSLCSIGSCHYQQYKTIKCCTI